MAEHKETKYHVAIMFPLDDSIPKSPNSGECVIRFHAIRGKVSEIWNLLQTNFPTLIDSLLTASWNPLFHICLRAFSISVAVFTSSGFANLVLLLLWYHWCQSNLRFWNVQSIFSKLSEMNSDSVRQWSASCSKLEKASH